MIDTHVHVWGAPICPLPWLDGSGLPSEVTPDELAHPGADMVLVTADAAPEHALGEARALSAMSRQRADVAGFVAGVDLVGDVARQLDDLEPLPGFLGVRHNLQDVLATLDERRLVAGWQVLAGRGVPFDVCVRAPELPHAGALLRRVPGLIAVLDHMGKPPVRDADAMGRWRAEIANLAHRDLTWCKLSGLPAEVGGLPSEEDLRRTVDHVVDAFGVTRCLVGSDRPISDDPAWCERVLDRVPPDHRRLVSATNAARAYPRLQEER